MRWPGRLKLHQMIEQAMQDQAPQMYARMKANGTLQGELEIRVAVAEEIRELQLGAPGSPLEQALSSSETNLSKRAGLIQQAQSAATEAAFSVAFQFGPESQTEAA